MNEQKDKKSLDELISHTIGGRLLEFDLYAWKKHHQQDIQQFKTKMKSPRALTPVQVYIWRTIMKNRITKLAAVAVILILIVLGIKLLGTLRVTNEPDTGMKVVKNDENKGTGNGTNEKENLREEYMQIEQMYAAHNIDGLVSMLSDGQPTSKAMAANYLAKIGDTRAIAALELLDSQSDDTDNPFGQAVRQIKKRLEQQTLKTQPQDDNDVNVANLVRPEPNVVRLPMVVNIAASGSAYDHFLFIRLNKWDGEGGSKTLVLAKVTPEGFEFRDINTQPVSRRPWERPVCVVGGRLYAKHGEGELSGMNLATGQTEALASDDDESVYSLLNLYGSHSYAYDDGRLYGQAGKDEDAMTLRVLDFRTRAYRDITPLDRELEWTTLAISPDHKRVAYFVVDPNGCLLNVVDVDSGQVMHPTEPIRFVIPLASSSWYAPPLFWVDGNRLVFIRTEVWSRDADDAMNKVAVIDVGSGQMADIVTLPGNPYGSFIRMTQRNERAGLRIWIDRFGKFCIDLAEAKLIEDETIDGDYLVSEGYLFYGEHELGGPIRWDGLKDLEISPDAKRAIWISEGKLFYHDSASEAAVPVTEDSNTSEGLLWLKAEDLKVPTVAADIPDGWIAFEDSPPSFEDDNEEGGRRIDRKDIKDHLLLTVETDKDAYFLHEPVEVTLTVTNTSDTDIEVVVPSIFAGASLEYPGGSTAIDYGAEPYQSDAETVMLKPGELVSATDTLEVALVGDYKIRYEYEGFNGEWRWRGDLEGQVIFTVNPVGSPDQEQGLFEAKFERLMAKFRRELSMAPNWNGYNDTVGNKITGMVGMGPNVATYLMEVIRKEQSDVARGLLYRPLDAVAGAEALPFFLDRLAQGEVEPACQWLYDLYEKGQQGSAEALASLFSAMKHENADVRRKAAGELAGIYDPNVRALFETAIEGDDQQIRMMAARYLARAEWLDLDEWLDLAANEPTHARYIAAKSIINELEEKWNVTKGRFPAATWKEASKDSEKLEQFRQVLRAWHEWASENLRFSSEFFDREQENWVNRR